MIKMLAYSILMLVMSPVGRWVAPAETHPVRAAVAERVIATGFAADRSDLDLHFGAQPVPYRVMGVFALPAEDVSVEIGAGVPGYRLEASNGTVRDLGGNRWSWVAPASSGTAVLRVRRPDGTEAVTLNAFVMVPYAEMKRGSLNGYEIGEYPAPRAGRSDLYMRPRGFVAITAETQKIQLSPHFQLGQFACKSGAGLPKYAVVQPRLLLRLEGLLETANREGIHAHTFQVMSAYRTPRYNRSIGNVTTFTRHQYGDAADIFVDEQPVDGRMDDLNHDGRFDRGDALVLSRMAAETENVPEDGGVKGGLSAYEPNRSHGPFVHVDTRGYVARW